MKELDLPLEEHIVTVESYDFGIDHRIKLVCTCNARWTIANKGNTEQAVIESAGNHIHSLKRPPTKPD